MTIDEAIARERQQAKEQRNHIGTWDEEYSKKCEEYAEEHDQLAEWLEELKSLREYKERMEMEEYNGGWISVKDRLPDKAGSYLVIGKLGGATVTRWYMPSEFYPEGHFGGNSSDYIRYWMPRPEPPKESD